MRKNLQYLIIALLMFAAIISQAQTNTYTVTRTNDPDPYLYDADPNDTSIVGTLQWAIRTANDATGQSLINFAISGNGPQLINLIYQLPAIYNEITLDATTQTGYSQGNPSIIIDGGNTIPIGFYVTSSNCNIKGFYIQNFTAKGISVYGADGFTIESNIINRIIAPAPRPGKPCIVPACGIALSYCTNGKISANIIGTDVTLATGLEIQDWGLALDYASNCTIGGISSTDGNIIAYCKTGINQPSNCMQYRKNKFIGNNTAFANISNRCSQLPLSAPVLFNLYTSNGYTYGYIQPGSSIDIFGSDGTNNASEYITTATADNAGLWTANITTSFPYLRGIETDVNNCSSVLSASIAKTSISGLTCNSAITLPATPAITNLQMSDSILWMSFIADTTTLNLKIQVPVDTPIANISYFILYKGSCGGLLELVRKNKDLGESLEIIKNDLVIGDTYYLVAQQLVARTSNFELKMDRIRPLVIDAGSDKITIKGKNIIIGGNPTANQGNPPYTFSWTPANTLDNPNVSNPTATPLLNTLYTVVVTDSYGNTSSDNILVKVEVPIERENVVQSIVDSSTVAYDRFGRTYKADALEQSQIKSIECNPTVGNLTFALDFTPHFMSSTAYANMQPIICQVFKDLAYLVQPPSPVTVNILIGSEQDAPQYGGAMPSNALAGASAFYHLNPQSNHTGIIDGDVWKAINTGQNTTAIDGYIMVNMNFAWHYLDLSLPTPINSPGFYDAYSVLLHEAYHLLGFNSLIGSLGQSLAPSPFLHYSRFDQYLQSLETGTPNNLISWDGCYDAHFNLNTSAITATCNNIIYDGPANFGQQPIYAPASFEAGSTLSHFDNSCAPPGTNYLMHPNISDNHEHRKPTTEEVQVLCDIGYNVTGQFGAGNYYFHSQEAACSDVIAGVDDGVWTMANCTGSTIEISTTSTYNPITNDINAVTIECLKLSSGSGTLTGSIYTPNTNTIGFITLTYIPVNANGIRGNITSIKIFVTPCGGTECNNQNLCNMVCNSDFQTVDPCVITYYYTLPGQPMHNCHFTPFDENIIGYQAINAWHAAFGTPQWYMEGVEPALQDGFAAMWNISATNGEGIWTAVNIQAGKHYVFSYYRKASPSDPLVVANLDNAYVQLGYSLDPSAPVDMAGAFTVLHETNIITPDVPNETIDGWRQVVVCFTATANYNQLFIYPVQTSNESAWLFVDRVQLVEDKFPTTDANININTCVVNYDLPDLCSVDNITYQWFADYDDNGIFETPLLNPSSPTDPIFNPNPPYPLYDAPIGQNVQYEYIRTFPVNPSTVVDPSTLSCTLTTHFVNAISPSPIVLNITGSDISPCNAGNGTATVNVISGGTAPFTYQWHWGLTPGTISTDQNLSGLNAGTYDVTVADANGCEAYGSIIIYDNLAPDATITGTNITCNGLSDGTATVLVNNGTSPPYLYLWNTNAITNSIQGLTSGLYTVTVTDANNCKDIASISILQFSALSVSVYSQSDVMCNGGLDNGHASVTVTGGESPYIINWSDGSNGTIHYNLAAGTYTVSVVDNSTCSTTIDITIGQPATPLSLTISSTDVSCYGGNNGSATAIASGGTSGFSYHWNTVPVCTTATVTGLTVGSYTVTVKDAHNCEVIENVTISEPPDNQLEINFVNIIDNTCYGNTLGSATVVVNGGSGNYTYLWNTNPIQTDVTAINLAAGIYYVSVFDNDLNFCEATFIEIHQPDPLFVTIQKTDISCFGLNNGTATANATGGTQPYSYLWTDGSMAQTDVNLYPGVYFVTVVDVNNCPEATANITILEPVVLTSNITSNDVKCNGNNNGTATITAIGGTSPYTYLWNSVPSQSTVTAINLSIGTYHATITDNNGCTTVTQDIVITEPDILTVFIDPASIIEAKCFGDHNGHATATASGGIFPYSYHWTGGQITATANNLGAGNNTVIVTDANGCTASANVTITQPTKVIVSMASHINNNCFGGTSGSSTVGTISGGTPPYQNWYLWTTTPNQILNTPTINNLPAGTFYVYVKDVNNCYGSINVTISQPPKILISVIQQQNVSCYGMNDGSATVNATGGTGSLTYLWSNGQTSATATNLQTGPHTVTITDANLCTETLTITITEPTILTTTIGSQVNVGCNGGSDGVATVTVAGGTPGYTYVWSTGGSTTATASGLTIGNYYVTVTDTKGCTKSAFVVITQPPALTATMGVPVNVSCNGGNNGSATVTAGGGTPNYIYTWSAGGSTTATASGLTAGNYYVSVTDTKGCTKSAFVVITQPPALTATMGVPVNVSCNGGNNGSATVTAGGGMPNYIYAWSAGGSTTATASNLTAGNYYVTVTDTKGCTKSAFVQITQPTALTATMGIPINVSCNGGNNGIVTVAVAGGSPGYTYVWSAGGSTTATASGLTTGNYYVTVTDTKGCTKSAFVQITQPTALTATMGIPVNVSCNGGNNGSVTVAVAGGTPGYTFVWSAGGSTTATASGLTIGNYYVTVTDTKGCTKSAFVQITEPTALTATIGTPTNVSCYGGNNGSANVAVAGGTPGYTFVWSAGGSTTATASGLTAGNYYVSVTDTKGCTKSAFVQITQPTVLTATMGVPVNVSCNGGNNGSATVIAGGGTPGYTYAWSAGGSITAIGSGLTSGLVFVTVTDANSCTKTSAVIITQPTALVATMGIPLNVSCNGGSNGSATVAVAGGTPGYTFVWSSGGSITATASGLTAGNYYVTVTDIKGCTKSAFVQITQPTALTATMGTPVNLICNGENNGSATVTAGGGTPGYTYAWSAGGSTTAIASGLIAGNYYVSVTDTKGCTKSAFVQITQPTAISATITGVNVLCNGGSTGSASITGVTGGIPPYTYTWSNGAATQSISGLTAGIYTVDVKDANGCIKTSSITITQALPVVVHLEITSPLICNGVKQGSITATVTNGVQPFKYVCSDGQSSAVIEATTYTFGNLLAGTYTVTVYDANSCEGNETITLTQPPPMVVTANVINTSCLGNCNGSIAVNVTGGVPGYSYYWSTSPAQITSTISGLCSGVYNLTITDDVGCKTLPSFMILSPQALAINVTGTNATCNMPPNGSAMANVTGGTPPYSFSWSNGLLTQSISGLAAGTYTVTATDANNCTPVTSSVTISQPHPIDVIVSGEPNDRCPGSCDGWANVMMDPGYFSQYQWSNGGTTQYIYGLCSPYTNPPTSTTYTVTVTLTNGCQGVGSISTIPFNFDATWTNTSVTSMYGTVTTPYVISDQVIWVIGTFIVDRNLILNNCELRMDANAQIIVNNAITLTLDRTDVVACKDKWNRIFLADQKSQLIVQNTTGLPNAEIRGAITAVESNNAAFFDISNVTFRENTTCIFVHNWIGLHSGKIAKTKFTNYLYSGSTGISLDGGASIISRSFNLNQPGDNTFENFKIAVNSHNVAPLNIQNCIFTNSYYGIWIHNTNTMQQNNANISKCDFTIDATYTGPVPIGIGILNVRNLTLKTCSLTFNNAGKGINIINSQLLGNPLDQTSIQNCSVNNTDIGLNTGSNQKITIKSCSFANNNRATSFFDVRYFLKISNSTFTNNNFGVFATKARNANVNNNTFSGHLTYTNSANTALTIQSAAGIGNATVSSNTYSSVINGVHFVNLTGSGVDGETVTSMIPISGVSTSGINIEGCSGTSVTNNSITGSGATSTSQNGISFSNSPSTVKGNSLIRTGNCLLFSGSCLPSEVSCNIMYGTSNVGLQLFQHGIIGQQGDMNCPTSDNKWYGMFNYAQTLCNNSYGSGTYLFVVRDHDQFGAAPQYKPTNNRQLPPPPSTQASPFLPSVKNGCTYCPNSSNHNGQTGLQQIATNQINYRANIVASRWLSKDHVYKTVKNTQSLLHNPLYAAFLDSMSASTAGFLYNINTAISDTLNPASTATVGAVNNAIVPANTIEENLKAINNIYFFMLNNGTDSLSVAQLAELRRIAYLCPFTDGNAVYSARVILSLIDTVVYMNDCEDADIKSNAKMLKNEEIQNDESLNVMNNESFNCYPNPVSEILYLDYQLNNQSSFEIFDIIGRKILQVSLTGEQTIREISVKNLVSGLYYFKVSDSSGNVKFSDKILIAH